MPRKKKPLYRLRNVILVLALLLALGIGREVYLAVTAQPGQSEDFPAKVAALIEASQPRDVPIDSPNAVVLLDRAIAIEAEVQADIRSRVQMTGGHHPVDYSLLRGPMSNKPYGAEVFEQIKATSRQAIERLRTTEFPSLLDQVAGARRAVRPTPSTGPLVGFLLPNLGRYRNLARLNGARMYLAHQAGDDDELVRAFEHTLAIGRVAASGSFLIEYLVGIAIHALAISELREELVERAPSEATLVRLLAAMDRQPLPSAATVIEGERLSVLDTIQWTHTDDGRGSGRMITSKVSELTGMWGGGNSGFLDVAGGWRIMNLAGAAFPSKASNIRKANEFFDRVLKAHSLPLHARPNAPAEIGEYEEQIPVRYVLLRMILPAWSKSIQSSDNLAATWDGTRIMIALEIFKHRRGRYPVALQELSPEVMATAPVDPYSGRPFGYIQLEAGSDPNGRGYLLYTVAADGKDDAGKMAKSPHEAFRPEAGRGFDFVLNQPRALPEPDVPVPAAPEEETPAPETPEAPPAPTAEPESVPKMDP